MAKYLPDNIHNVALVGHGDAGKTTLAEHLLFATQATARLGSVKDGSSASDFLEDEKERKHSIDPGILHFEHGDQLVHLLDCPGFPDFLGDALCCLEVVETAVVVVSAAAGIAVNTRRMWHEAGERKLARMIVLNKLDLENLDLPGLLEKVQEKFGAQCVPFSWPDATGAKISKIADVWDPPAGLAGELADALGSFREAAIERIVEADEALMEKYFAGEVDAQALAAHIPAAVAGGRLVPVFVTSLEKGLGVEPVLKSLVRHTPPASQAAPRVGVDPATRGPGKTEARGQRAPKVEEPFSAQVFAVMTDDYVGRISYFRVLSGKLTHDQPIYNPDGGKPEKMGALLRIQGKEQKAIQEAVAGDIVGITKVEHTGIGQTLCDQARPVLFPRFKLPRPMVSLAVTPKSRMDDAKIGTSLKRIMDEDATFHFERHADTHESVASGVTDLHLRLMLDRLKKRFHVDIETRPPRIAYFETITKASPPTQYRHKKQTGGRGQFGEVHIKIEPLPRGKGFEFSDDVVGGAIPNQLIPAVEKGIRHTMEQGVIAGYPVVDLKVSLYDGKYHPVDSGEEAFKRAGSEAFKLAVAEAGPTLLEPIVNLDVTVPTERMGDITGDLNGRRGHIIGMESGGDHQTIKVKVPLAEVMHYSTELRSMTQGEGTYSMEQSHYDIVPAHKVAEIVKQAKLVREELEKEKTKK